MTADSCIFSLHHSAVSKCALKTLCHLLNEVCVNQKGKARSQKGGSYEEQKDSSEEGHIVLKAQQMKTINVGFSVTIE